jgi:hypothetical protein
MSFISKLKIPVSMSALPDLPGELLLADDDFIIAFNARGEPFCKFRNPSWNFGAYSRTSTTMRFFPDDALETSIEFKNGTVLKRLMLLWLFGRNSRIAPNTASDVHSNFCSLLKFCNSKKILITDLSRFPNLYIDLVESIPPSKVKPLLRQLREVAANHDLLGFGILSYAEVALIAKTAKNYFSRQTAYIPTRIYAHVLGRCEQYVEEFLPLLPTVRGAMATFAHEYRASRELPEIKTLEPPLCRTKLKHAMSKLEAFACRWIGEPSDWAVHNQQDTTDPGTRWYYQRKLRISQLLDVARFVAQILTTAYSGMRLQEMQSLTALSFRKEVDISLGTTCFLEGKTTKTVKNDHALWVVPERMESVVQMAKLINETRRSVTNMTDVNIVASGDDSLWLPNLEPWIPGKYKASRSANITSSRVTLAEWPIKASRLFDSDILRITEEDQKIAKLLTLDLDEKKFAVGNVWPLGFHQLRRTLICNAASSGLVSVESLQYQMKHMTRVMTEYYMRRHTFLRLNESMKRDFADAVVDCLTIQATELSSDRFFSPFGIGHKAKLIEFVRNEDKKSLTRLAQTGQFAIRENALGLCLHNGVCEFGGYENLANCVKCHEALLNREKVPDAKAQLTSIEIERASLNSTRDALYIKSLDVQAQILRTFIDVAA